MVKTIVTPIVNLFLQKIFSQNLKTEKEQTNYQQNIRIRRQVNIHRNNKKNSSSLILMLYFRSFTSRYELEMTQDAQS